MVISHFSNTSNHQCTGGRPARAGRAAADEGAPSAPPRATRATCSGTPRGAGKRSARGTGCESTVGVSLRSVESVCDHSRGGGTVVVPLALVAQQERVRVERGAGGRRRRSAGDGQLNTTGENQLLNYFSSPFPPIMLTLISSSPGNP